MESAAIRLGRFRPGWRMTLFVGLMLPVLVSLGSWQLSRAEEKRQFEESYLDRISALGVEPGEVVAPFQRLKLSGSYEADRYFLLDNQTRRGAVGFVVVSSFLASDGRRWLINRGFIPGDGTRRSLPVVESPSGPVTLVGLAWPELGLMPVFGADEWSADWPKLVQRLEVVRMAALLANAEPLEVRLEAGQKGVFDPAVTELNMPAAKHTGYAVQWFGLAMALGIGYLFFGFRRHD